MKDNKTMNKPVIESKKVRKKFDRAFKEHAVELGFHAQRLSAWRRRFAPPPPGGEGGGGAKRSAAQWEAENAGLRRENDYLRQQRDILKKTLGILSEPPTSGSNGLTR